VERERVGEEEVVVLEAEEEEEEEEEEVVVVWVVVVAGRNVRVSRGSGGWAERNGRRWRQGKRKRMGVAGREFREA
jgi:hypothetical protein